LILPEHAIRGLILDGRRAGAFDVASVTMASFAILEMSVIASWFRDGRALSADDVAGQYGEFALSIARSNGEPSCDGGAGK
jgi:hypothetical protein